MKKTTKSKVVKSILSLNPLDGLSSAVGIQEWMVLAEE